MKIGSLFAGIGGLELGLARAIPGARVAWQVEQDPYARAVLAKHWPAVPRYEDVRTVGAHNLSGVDLICGGFPCQDISAAGNQQGIKHGTRSGLWFEYARIVSELRPRFVVVENVAALLSGGMGIVLGDLAACGYDAIWDCVPAQAVGAHHRRDRVFIFAWLADFHSARLERHGPAGNAGQVCPQKAASMFRRSLGHVAAWEPEPNVGRVASGVPRRVDRLRCLGNAVVPQVAEVIGRVVAEIAAGGPPKRRGA